MSTRRGRVAPSALLACLQQLNDDVWAEYLLPKLVQDRSAGNVALTCSSLRSLVQRNHDRLNLSSLGSSSSTRQACAARAWQGSTHTVAEHFPNCRSVTMRIGHERSYLVTPAVAQALSRLALLNTIRLHVDGVLQPLALAMAISSLSQQLPQLRDLCLTAKQSWAGAQLAWDQLGTATQLTALAVGFPASVINGCNVQNVAALRGLTGLRQLSCNVGKRRQQQQQQDEQEQLDMAFLGDLTALTHLDMPVWTANGLSSISSCSALQVLRLRSSGQWVNPSPEDWAALGQLTQLTRLYVSRVLQNQNQQPFCEALQSLTRLESVSAGHWTPAVLPAFAAMPRLSYVKGAWREVGEQQDGAVAIVPESYICSQVVSLDAAAGCVPFGAFPNLTSLVPAGSIDADSWVSLGNCCHKLMSSAAEVDVKDLRFGPSVPLHTDAGVHVAALKGLSQLTALTQLSFHTSNQFEVGVLADAGLPLKDLTVVLVGDVIWVCVVPLAKLTTLTSLSLVMPMALDSSLDAAALLSAVSHVPKVTFALDEEGMDCIQMALSDARQLGLKVPVELKLVPTDTHALAAGEVIELVD